MAKRELDKPEVQPVVTGKVSKKTKGLFGGFIEKDDIKDIAVTVWEDNFKPDIKKGLFNGIMAMVEMAIFGEISGRFTRTAGSRVAYNSFSNRNSNGITKYKKGYPRSRYDVEQFEFEEYLDADKVLDTLTDQIEKYDCFTVADYYRACKQPYEYTDDNYGWFSMEGIRIARLSNGLWTIDFSDKPQPIKN